MSQKTIAVGADHGGYEMKEELAKQLDGMGFKVLNLGTDSSDSVDYPDFALLVVKAIEDGNADQGVLVCGSGIGMSIAANRHKGIRAALCNDAISAELARQHNDANILVLGERLTEIVKAKQCVERFFSTDFEGGRHERRVKKLG
ncbi:MAG: ribose 5-phosphate isomerase B [Rhodospirillaceae bacterium]|nr:ribose 5-phosphate isomerase B [Rhodospirillaceae bacterium]|tara:strand:+ start:1551 stop:1985 length:435 start_codon:yes stop_codon:yes gene_type:complete